MGAALPMSGLFSSRNETALAERAAALCGRPGVPGLAFAVAADGSVVAERAFGVADLGAARPLATSHVFQAASLAKCVTAWTVLQLAEAGRVDLDAPIARYVERWRLPPSAFDHSLATVRRILSHTAGLSLPDYPGFEPSRPLPTLEASLAGETNGGGDLRVVEPPGARFRYSGGGFALLQLAIEELTGERFAARVARTVFAPLGMTRSTFDPGSPLLDSAATGHDPQGHALPFYRLDGAAAAGLVTTAGDLARFAAAHLPGPHGEPAGRGVVSPSAIVAMTTPHVRTGRRDGLWALYGLGFEVEQRADGRTIVGHHGMNRGWRALAAIEPAGRRAIALLANSDAAMPALEELLATWLESR